MPLSPIVSTPFREHYEHCRRLDLQAQLEECADYLQHSEVLIQEFLESYYLVERLWEPGSDLRPAAPAGSGDPEDSAAELVLEPFYESLELCVGDSFGSGERIVCVSGALSPLPGEAHPALSRRGLDYVGLSESQPPQVILGVAQATEEDSPYLLLLRALNCFAELAPPFRVIQLGREVVRAGLPESTAFSLQLGVAQPDDSEVGVALSELCRDLAEVFKRRSMEEAQLSGTLGRIECVEIDAEALASGQIRRFWGV